MIQDSWLRKYLAITFGVVGLAAFLVLGLEGAGISIYGKPFGFVLIAVGGGSSAVAGALVSKKSGKISSYYELLRSFFEIKQPIIFYLGIILALSLTFGTRILGGQLQAGKGLMDLGYLFIIALLFGGIEEIGWRFWYQPTLERSLGFFRSTLLTSITWGIWHLLYFVIEGSLWKMTGSEIFIFLINIIGFSFLLSGIFRITKSLWLCVFCHALMNALIQTYVGLDIIQTCMSSLFTTVIVTIFVSIYSHRFKAN